MNKAERAKLKAMQIELCNQIIAYLEKDDTLLDAIKNLYIRRFKRHKQRLEG